MISQQYIEGVIVVGLNKEEQYHHLCTRFRVSSSSLLREAVSAATGVKLSN